MTDGPRIRRLRRADTLRPPRVHLHPAQVFVRCALVTLDSTLYTELPKFPLDEYRDYCRSNEDDCLKAGGYGGKWSNNSCEKQFGPASPPKDLAGNGSPRWKQRAFYDFIKDLSPLVTGVRIARVALWDSVDEAGEQRTVRDLLTSPMPESSMAIASLLRERA